MMRYSLGVHRGISLFGLVLLVSVLFYLTYNTFKLRDEQYQIVEKSLLNDWYTKSIRNDKVFPGGVKIIDPYLMDNLYQLEKSYNQDSSAFDQYKNRLLDSMFHDLRLGNTMNSLFEHIKTPYGLDEDIEYLLSISNIQLVFRNGQSVNIYRSTDTYDFLPDSLKTRYGVIIGGKLRTPLPQNLIASFTVSSAEDYNYWMTFSFHADHSNRTWYIIKSMTPTFLLALFAIGCVVSIYYVTYRNWLRQKKLAEMKSDFVNSITHEFNTPLSTIIVANKNMQNDRILADANNIRPLTKIVERQALHLQKLFEQVMDITTLDDSTLQKESCEFNQLLHDLITDYSLKVGERNIRMEWNGTAQPLIVELNKFFFTTMLYNLFDNAIKYNQNNQKRIVVDLFVSPILINLRITDNGTGIPDSEIEHIFEKFYRVQKQGSQHIPGLGLGLYYTYQCIKSHGWTLSVTSEERIGTQFTIHIPHKN